MQIGRGRGGFYTYTAIERLLAADIDNLDRIDPNPQTLKPGERIWMTPERYLSHLPVSFGGYARRARTGTRAGTKTAREPAASHLVVGGAASGRSRDPTAGPAPRRTASRGISGSPSETFRLVGTFLMECGMLRGIKARAEQSLPQWRFGPALISLISGQEPVPITVRWLPPPLTNGPPSHDR